MINWDQIDAVFLDMDGTLLDLHFDNHFWREFVPSRYALNHGLPIERARELLYKKFSDHEGTIQWYSVDFWSAELSLDIEAMKGELQHLISVLPHVEDFLARLKGLSLKRTLVTNAHRRSIDLKFACTGLGNLLDEVICAHDLGLPKEAPGFWQQVHAIHPFDRRRTLFVDDSITVLMNAQVYGFDWLVGICKPDSKRAATPLTGVDSVEDFSTLLSGMPG